MRDIEQLRRDLEEAVAALSPDARRVWETLQEYEEARVEGGEEHAVELPPGYSALPPSEQEALVRVLRASAEVNAAQAEENEGIAALMHQAVGVILRAQELEPGLGDNPALEDAIAVLKRHGEPSGLSPELSDMVVEVPTERSETGEERVSPAFYPDFTEADKLRRWDGSEQAEAWARLMTFRDECIETTVEMLAGMGIEDIDYAGVLGLLWGIGADEAAEIVRRRQGL